MEDNKQITIDEINIDIIESQIGLIIASLEDLIITLEGEKINVDELKKIMVRYFETIDFDQELIDLANELLNMSSDLIAKILALDTVDRFEVLNHLFDVLILASLTIDENLFFDQDASLDLEDLIIIMESKLHQILQPLLQDLKASMNEPNGIFSDEMKKIINILTEETKLLDLNEGSYILLDLFYLEASLDDGVEILNIYQDLMKINTITSWYDVWLNGDDEALESEID